MRRIFLFCPDEKSGNNIKSVLNEQNISVSAVFNNSSDVLNRARSYEDGGIVITVKATPLSSGRLIDLLPLKWDLIIILPSGQMPSMYHSNTTYLTSPLSKTQFTQTVLSLTNASSASFQAAQSAHLKRSASDEKIISAAKAAIMENMQCSEDKAYKYLRAESMEKGTKIIEIAKSILNNK